MCINKETLMNVCIVLLALFISVVSGAETQGVHRTLAMKETECYGTSQGFSYTGNLEFHYKYLRRKYSGCTYVIGNLEVTHLNQQNVTYDISFLSTIKVVTGYVLLGNLNTEVIPLTSLRLIKAETTMEMDGERYGLVVVLTYNLTPTPDNPRPGLKELQLPELREISRGNVYFKMNPYLCFIDTIDWFQIAPWRVEMKINATSNQCGECEPHCADSHGVRRCWGAGNQMCQKGNDLNCHYSCHGRCFKEGMLGCCHPSCAGGCHGGMDTECEMCKHFKYGHKCVPQCPPKTYPIAQECISF